MDINKFIVSEEMPICEVMKNIDQNVRGTAFVCRDGILLASVSDGDIRRYLMRNGSLQTRVGEIANYDPIYLPFERRREAVEQMKRYSIGVIPIVDHSKKIVDIKLLVNRKYEPSQKINVPLVIMAGGKGTRLKPYTDILPKPLIPIDEKPIVEHIIEHFEAYHCLPIYMIVNYKKNFIKAYFTEDKERDIIFLEEAEYLGTGGGLKLLQGQIKDTFFMTNCDVLVEADYAKMMSFHKEKKNIITMICAKKKVVIPYGTVSFDEQGYALELLEKPQYEFNTNTGIYIIEPEFLQKIPDGKATLITDMIEQCIREGEKVGVFLIDDEDWMDMGQLEELEKMREKLGLSIG